MRQLLLVPLLLVAGCGSSTETTSAPSLPDQRVPITAADGVQTTRILLNAAEADQGGTELLVPNFQLFTNIDLQHPAATAEAMASAYGLLVQRGSSVVNGTRGGSFQSTVTGSFVSVVFQNFATTTGNLTGNVTYQGTSSNTSYSSQATIGTLRVTPVNGTVYTLEGPAGYNSTLTGPTSSTNQFRTNASASDSNGGIVRYADYGTNTDLRVEGNTVTGSASKLGRLTLAQYRGLTGICDVTTPQTESFSGSSVFSGQLLFVGNGTSRLTVVSQNQVEVAVSAGEGQPFQVLQVLPYASLFD